MLFTIIWAHSPQIALKYDYIATKFGGGQLSSNGWISEPPVLATPPLQQRLKVLFFVRLSGFGFAIDIYGGNSAFVIVVFWI